MVLENVDWPCKVQRLYQTDNLGCKRGVGTAIDWFLANEDSGIILEDDCLPSRRLLSVLRRAPRALPRRPRGHDDQWA